MRLTKAKRDQLIVAVLFSAMAVFLIKGTLMGMQDTKIAQLEKNLVEAEAKATEAKRTVGRETLIKAELVDVREALERVESGMPTEGNAYAWITQTINNYRNDRLAQYPNLEFRDFQPPVFGDIGVLPTKSITAETGIPYRGARFRISGVGYYHELGKFLADFENDFRYTRFENLVIETLSEGITTDNTGVGATQSELLQFKVEVVAPILTPNS